MSDSTHPDPQADRQKTTHVGQPGIQKLCLLPGRRLRRTNDRHGREADSHPASRLGPISTLSCGSVTRQPLPPGSTEAVGKPVCGSELAGSRLMRLAEIEAGCQARIASINGLTPRIAITRFML